MAKEITKSVSVRLPMDIIENLRERGTLSDAIRNSTITIEVLETILHAPTPLPNPNYRVEKVAEIVNTVATIGEAVRQHEG